MPLRDRQMKWQQERLRARKLEREATRAEAPETTPTEPLGNVVFGGAQTIAGNAAGAVRMAWRGIWNAPYAFSAVAESLRETGELPSLSRIAAELYSDPEGVMFKGNVLGKDITIETPKPQRIPFAEEMAQLGIPELGRPSDIPLLGLAYSESGKGLPLQKRGLLDPSVRDVAGFVGETVSSPLSSLRVGKGLEVGLARTPAGKVIERVLASKKGALTYRKLFDEQLKARFGQPVVDLAQKLSIEEMEEIRDQAATKLWTMAAKSPDLLQQPALEAFGVRLPGSARIIAAGTRLRGRAAARLETWTPYQKAAELAQHTERMFSVATRGARKFANVEETMSRFHAQRRNTSNEVRKTVDGWVKSVKDGAPINGTALDDYIRNTLDDPERFPVDALPPEAKALVEEMKLWHAEHYQALTGLGYRINQRENYIKHIYHVGIEGKKPRPITSGEWEQLGGDASIRHLGGVISKNIGGATEARTYVTYTDAITTLNKTAKDRGLNWTLSAAPLEESLLTHGLDYSEAVAAGKMEATFLRDHGIDPELAAEQHFKNILPEVHNLVFNGVEKLEGAYKAQGAKLQTIMERYIGRTQTKAMARFATQKTTTRTPEQVLQQAARMGSKLAMESVRGRKLIKRQDELTKAFYWMTKLRSVGSLKEFEELAAEHPAALGIPDDLITGMREYVGTSYRNFTNTFRDQYDKVLLNYEGKSRTFFLPKPIADDARRLLETRPLPPEMRKALHYYDTATSLWKAGITTWVPAFFGRNGYNNVITSYVDAGISSQLRGPKAASILAGREGTIQSPTLGKLTHSQFRDALRFYGVLNEPDFALEVGGTARRTKILAHGPVRWGQQTNAYIENWAKVTLALAHVERGAGLKEAAWRVQQTLFDYDYLTSLEKSWFRRVMPFYTWFRKNIALYSRLLPTETGRIATIERFNATHKDRGPENGALGDYLSGAFKLRSEQHGKATYWYGIDLPHRAFLDNFYVGDKGFERTLKKNGSMITPVLQALEAVRFQEDPITGADLNVPKEVMAGWSEVIQSLPQFTQDYLEFHKRKDGTWEMNGTKAYLLFNTLGLNRFMWPVTQYGEAKKKDYDIDNTLLDIALGINAETFDISDTKKREVRARIRAAEERLIRAGNHRPYTVSTPARRSNP